MKWPKEVVEKAEFEFKLFERTSAATSRELLNEVVSLREENAALRASYGIATAQSTRLLNDNEQLRARVAELELIVKGRK